MNLVEGKVNFDRAMARTLEVYNITIADAKSGHPTKDTLIPGTSATGRLFVNPGKSLDANSGSSRDSSSGGSAH